MVHQPGRRREGRSPRSPWSPASTTRPSSISSTTPPSKAGGRDGSASASSRSSKKARQMSSAALHPCGRALRGGAPGQTGLEPRAEGWPSGRFRDPGAQRAVRDDVRVAPDRGGEVTVARAAEAGVAEVPRAVESPLERAQHEDPVRTPAPRLARDDARHLRREVRRLLRGHLLQKGAGAPRGSPAARRGRPRRWARAARARGRAWQARRSAR